MTPAPSARTLAAFARRRCSAILRTQQADAVAPAMQAAVDGGFEIIEFTLNTPGALDQIEAFARDPALVVGAGTVLDLSQAQAAVDAGAQFIVSPVADPEVIRWCVERDLLCVPGVFTPAEMLAAHRAGAQVVKLFPGPPEGPAWVKVCRGPLPFLRIFPTSGVTEDNAAAYLEAGAFGVGFVNVLFEPLDLVAGRFEAIRERAERMVRAVEESPR
ncbi:MAG: bifunctional 4-hydroxy-2-oxoglutarate aldolase/2-dehydro-3-deoxy-phosphogluconate aldolase [Planctomycetes bacterium]|nr:bifunctional 4-hydroxy-2-oxoglutarate aldolase/2-dehydro-3-deoxy-phosphogluconate aldolase [Planctomycetota bacterium]